MLRSILHSQGFPGGSVGKSPPAHAGDVGSIPGLDKETAAHSCILAWEIAWTEELGGLQFYRVLKSRTQLAY